jgi:hypothetical protein
MIVNISNKDKRFTDMEIVKKKRNKNPRMQKLCLDVPIEMHQQIMDIAQIRNTKMAVIVRGVLEAYIISEIELYGN